MNISFIKTIMITVLLSLLTELALGFFEFFFQWRIIVLIGFFIKRYYDKNKEYYKEKHYNYYHDNNYKIYHREYYRRNKDRINANKYKRLQPIKDAEKLKELDDIKNDMKRDINCMLDIFEEEFL